MALTSSSAGRVRVSAHDAHRRPAGYFSTSQLHSATCRFAQSRYSRSSTAPACSLSGPGAMTSSALSANEKPSALPQDRHTEFSNANRCPQLGQVKSRTKDSTLERRDVHGHVDHTLLRVGVDDSPQRRHVGIVAAETHHDVALVDHLVVGGIEAKPLVLRCPDRCPC